MQRHHILITINKVIKRRRTRQRWHGVLNIHKPILRHSRIGDFALGLMINRKRSSLWSQALRSFWSQSSAIFFLAENPLEFTYLGKVGHTVCFPPPWMTESSFAPGRWGLIFPSCWQIFPDFAGRWWVDHKVVMKAIKMLWVIIKFK